MVGLPRRPGATCGRSAEAVVEEYLAWARPWCELRGHRDAGDPLAGRSRPPGAAPAWAQRLADAIPRSSVRLLPDEGHFLLLTAGEQVLRELVTS